MKFITFMVRVPKNGKGTQGLETNLSEKN